MTRRTLADDPDDPDDPGGWTRMTLAYDPQTPDDPRPDDPDDPVGYKRTASNAVRHSEKSSRSVHIEAEKPQEELKSRSI